MVSVNVTVSMPPEMLEDIEQEADARGMSRAQYLRHLIRQADDSPFDRATDDVEEDTKGAA